MRPIKEREEVGKLSKKEGKRREMKRKERERGKTIEEKEK